MSPNTRPSLPIVAAASSSSSPASATNATPVIIGVTVSVGSVLLLVVAFRIWNCTRPPKAPLPPKGPLAHDRQRHAAAGFAQPAFPIRAQEFMHMPLPNNASYPGHTRQASSRTEIASIPPSSPSIVSSQAHLVSESDENADVRGRQPSLGSPANARHHRGHRSRTVSNTGSVRSTRSRQSSLGTIRGPPHHHHVNIVLPQPLAPGLYNNNNTFWQPPFPRAPTREKRSESCDRGAFSVPLPRLTSHRRTLHRIPVPSCFDGRLLIYSRGTSTHPSASWICCTPLPSTPEP